MLRMFFARYELARCNCCVSCRSGVSECSRNEPATWAWINMGNALDGPSEGAWGMKIEKDYFALMKQAGFQSVRIQSVGQRMPRPKLPTRSRPRSWHE